MRLLMKKAEIAINEMSGFMKKCNFQMPISYRGQPAANPAAEQPSNVPSGASTSGWRSFEERVLLEPMPSSGESSEASVNQQPVIPELHPPAPKKAAMANCRGDADENGDDDGSVVGFFEVGLWHCKRENKPLLLEVLKGGFNRVLWR